MKLRQKKNVLRHKNACADEFIERFPNKYETHIEQGEVMYLVVRNRDFVLRERY